MASTASFSHCRIETASIKRNLLASKKFNLVKLVQRPVAVRSLKSNDAEKINKSPREIRLPSVAVGVYSSLILAFVEAELPREIPIETIVNSGTISEGFLKTFYLVFACVFAWGSCVFASMKDPYYESDEYRDAGGNGTQFWIYSRAEEAEQEAREELWREELKKEIEEKLGDVKALEEAEKEKELV